MCVFMKNDFIVGYRNGKRYYIKRNSVKEITVSDNTLLVRFSDGNYFDYTKIII